MNTLLQAAARGPIEPWMVAVGLALIALIWLAGTYNGLVRLRQHTAESWSGIDTELKRRYDLIPNLMEVCKGYAAHEKEVFERVVRARNEAIQESGGVKDQARKEDQLTRGLGRVLALAESYPDLKAASHFTQLADELTNTEDRIQAARRFYNANVRDLNTRCESFPQNLLASMFGFEKKDYFETQARDRAVPEVGS